MCGCGLVWVCVRVGASANIWEKNAVLCVLCAVFAKSTSPLTIILFLSLLDVCVALFIYCMSVKTVKRGIKLPVCGVKREKCEKVGFVFLVSCSQASHSCSR